MNGNEPIRTEEGRADMGSLLSPWRLYLWVWREGEGLALPWTQYCWHWPLRAAGMSRTERCRPRGGGACAQWAAAGAFGRAEGRHRTSA